MLTFFSWATASGVVVSTVEGVWYLLRSYHFQYVEVTLVKVNDDASVARKFIQLLDEAKALMIVYDDGNNTSGSLYNDRSVIDAVRIKLRSAPEFKLQCLFNCDDQVELRRELANEPQVDIRTRRDSGRGSKIHYKIIDGGEKAYLSRHEPGATKRRFRIVDCTGVPEDHRRRVAKSMLGRHVADFARAFNVAPPRG